VEGENRNAHIKCCLDMSGKLIFKPQERKFMGFQAKEYVFPVNSKKWWFEWIRKKLKNG